MGIVASIRRFVRRTARRQNAGANSKASRLARRKPRAAYIPMSIIRTCAPRVVPLSAERGKAGEFARHSKGKPPQRRPVKTPYRQSRTDSRSARGYISGTRYWRQASIQDLTELGRE